MLTFSYGDVTVSQADDPAAVYQRGYDDAGSPPPPRRLLGLGGGRAELRVDGMPVALEAPDRTTLLRAARARAAGVAAL